MAKQLDTSSVPSRSRPNNRPYAAEGEDEVEWAGESRPCLMILLTTCGIHEPLHLLIRRDQSYQAVKLDFGDRYFALGINGF
jgi:hypothetical protein